MYIKIEKNTKKAFKKSFLFSIYCLLSSSTNLIKMADVDVFGVFLFYIIRYLLEPVLMMFNLLYRV